MVDNNINQEIKNDMLTFKEWKNEFNKIYDMPIKSQTYVISKLLNSNVKIKEEEHFEYKECLEILKSFMLNISFISQKEDLNHNIRKIG